MSQRISDLRKLGLIGFWVATRGLAIAFAYMLLKFGQYAVRFV